MKVYFLISLLSLSGSINLLCQSIKLDGSAPQFANEEILIEAVENPITEQMVVLDTIRFDEDGRFNLEISIAKEQWIFIHSGIFHLRMFTQPGRGYKIILPPKTERTVSEFRNPFFQPYQAHIQVEEEYDLKDPANFVNEFDINSRIFRFDTLITTLNKRLFDAYAHRHSIDSDSIIQSIEKEFSEDTSAYFFHYRKFRYGLVKINSRDVGLQYIFENYLNSDIIDLYNPAYLELFNEMYNEFIFFFSKTDPGKSLPYLINMKQDIDELIDTLMKHEAIPSRKLAELILAREIYSIYEKKYFPKEALLNLLDSIVAHTEVKETIEITRGIKERLIKLEVGSKPPSFNLPDSDLNYYSLENFKGKYLYLIFCTPSNYGCMKEFPFLQVLHEAHSQHLQIVTVFVSESIHEMEDFMKKNNYNFTALFFDKNENLLQDYNVKYFPTTYLIDPEGLMVQSPASLATERFELDLYRIMKSRGDL
ncbi:TlpA family protein disulfide reductase [Bacteroidota bacterium]